MHTKRRLTFTLAILLIGVFVAGAFFAHAAEQAVVRSGMGKLTAVDENWETVVVEVPMNDKQLTVGGELAPGASVTKNKQTVGLTDLDINEMIQVTWRVTDRAIYILELHQK